MIPSQCPWGVSIDASAMNGKCGLTLLESATATTRKNKYGQRKGLKYVLAKQTINYRTYQNKDSFKRQNSVLNETFDDHRSFFYFHYFLWIHRFAKTYFLPFPPTIIECVHRSTWVNPLKWNFATSYLRQREHMRQIV